MSWWSFVPRPWVLVIPPNRLFIFLLFLTFGLVNQSRSSFGGGGHDIELLKVGPQEKSMVPLLRSTPGTYDRGACYDGGGISVFG